MNTAVAVTALVVLSNPQRPPSATSTDNGAAVAVSGVASAYCESAKEIRFVATNHSPSAVWVAFEVERRDRNMAWEIYQGNIELDWRSKAFSNRLLKPGARGAFAWPARLAVRGRFEAGEYRLVVAESSSRAGRLAPPATRRIGPSFTIDVCSDRSER